MRRALRLRPTVLRDGSGAHRVGVDAGGFPVWYESADLALDQGIEALAGALLMAALAAGRRLEIGGAVSSGWLDNIGRMLEVWRRWWDYPALLPRAPVLPEARKRAAGTGLCFTGGVDSFHTLLCGPVKPDFLAFVHGYDIPLADRRRMAAWERSLREVAAATGTRAVLLRSNLRQHPLEAACNWERSHGGALAAVGHLLAGQAGTLLISSGAPATYGYKWGSCSELDPLWSSDRLEVQHVGAERSRVAKVRALADRELVQRHLRVCWENRSATGNCSRCDKCLCTMVAIASCGSTGRFAAFDWTGSLADHIGRLPQTRFIYTYGELLSCGMDRSLAEAIRSLLARSPLLSDSLATPPTSAGPTGPRWRFPRIWRRR